MIRYSILPDAKRVSGQFTARASWELAYLTSRHESLLLSDVNRRVLRYIRIVWYFERQMYGNTGGDAQIVSFRYVETIGEAGTKHATSCMAPRLIWS